MTRRLQPLVSHDHHVADFRSECFLCVCEHVCGCYMCSASETEQQQRTRRCGRNRRRRDDHFAHKKWQSVDSPFIRNSLQSADSLHNVDCELCALSARESVDLSDLSAGECSRLFEELSLDLWSVALLQERLCSVARSALASGRLSLSEPVDVVDVVLRQRELISERYVHLLRAARSTRDVRSKERR